MKISKKQFGYALASIFIVLCAVTLLICQLAIPFNFWYHSALNFAFVLAVGFGVMSFCLAFTKGHPWWFFLGALLISLAIGYVVAWYTKLWWVALIIVGAFCIIAGILSYIKAGNQTESIAMNKPGDDYKDYKQRRAEKEEKEANEEKKELPKIKSFKD